MPLENYLVIHYHRVQHDYDNWHLLVQSQSKIQQQQQQIFAPLTKNATTSFGILFRIPISILSSNSISFLPIHTHHVDNPQRFFNLSKSTDHHLFISQHSSQLYLDPTRIILSNNLQRFAFFTFPTHPQSPTNPPPWLVVLPSPPVASIQLFPPCHNFRSKSIQLLYILDLLSIPNIQYIPFQFHLVDASIQNLSPQLNPHSITNFVQVPYSAADHTHPQGATLSYHKQNQNTNPQLQVIQPALDASHLLNILIQQADSFFVRSPISDISPFQNSLSLIDCNPPQSQPLIPSPPPTCLRVYLHNIKKEDHHKEQKQISVEPSSVEIRPLDKQYAGAQIFELDLSSISSSERKSGIVISYAGKHLQWTPHNGTHVVLAETFPKLLSPKDVDIRFIYHRFDGMADWKNWRLRIWSSKPFSDNDKEITREEIILQPARPVPHIAGMIFTKQGLIFPYDSTVHVQPFRETVIENEFESDSIHRESDIIRTFPSGSPPAQTIHLTQGDRNLYTNPSHSQPRKIRLRYRRFRPSDYDGWDLWTWDADDPAATPVSVNPVKGSETRAWIDFILDRAQYPAAAAIAVVPRLGAEEWKEKDDPPKIWRGEMLTDAGTGLEVSIAPGALPGMDDLPRGILRTNTDDTIPTFLIAQESDLVLTRLDDVRPMLSAYISGPFSVTIKSPVPVDWVSPPRRGRVHALSEAKFKLCEEPVARLLTQGYSSDGLRGSSLRFSKVKSVSPTKYTLIFEEKKSSRRKVNTTSNVSEILFHEDFLVENVVVSVPGFDDVSLQWERKENWDDYFYSGRLGWDYRREKCTFRCFAPTADQVNVVLYSHPTSEDDREVVPMRKIPEGCWKVIVSGDLKGKFYKLLATGRNQRLFPGVEVIDPYSRCNTGHTGRGLIFGYEDTKIHPRPNIKPSETIVYEFHVRDLTIDDQSGVKSRGKFLGVTERGTRMKDEDDDKDENSKILTPKLQEEMPGVDKQFKILDRYSTGLDHIAQMGVTAVQILPIQDFDNDESDDNAYRWGYMPVHYNSPDGWYASETDTVARVTEFKQLVDAVHKVGMKVIMDVVYNHTAEDCNEFNLEARFSFNGLVPRYYYRTCGNTPIAHTGDSTCGINKPDQPRCGTCYSNGSGCGNEFRSESPMGRKFIIDSLLYWATEYQVDGFRFDLLGLIDVDTLELASRKLKELDPNIIIYGEPWCGGLTPIKMTDKGAQRSKGFGVFNNTFRDAIRGSPFGIEETFVMDGGRQTEVKGGIIGSIDAFCDSPLETINYVECHDNYTLWDHMRFYLRSRTDDIKFTEVDMRRMSRLAAFIVFTSQGVPFMQAGQEMCRTKFDVENSYESPDEINMIRWKEKQTEWSTVQYYRGLILLRKSHPELFCKENAKEIRRSVTFYEDLGIDAPDRCIAFRISGDPEKLYTGVLQDNAYVDVDKAREESLKWTQVVVLLNPTPTETVFKLPEIEEGTIWFQVVDSTNAGVTNIRGPAIGYVTVQGRSAALLRRASEKDTQEAQLELRLEKITDSYACFHGDNVISRYAVGLDKEPTAAEKEEEQRLILLRKTFEANRKIIAQVQRNRGASSAIQSNS